MEHTDATSFWTLWWNAIDRWSFITILVLMAIGVWLIMAVSPAVALQHHWSPFVLLKRHFFILGPGLILLISTTLFQKNSLVLFSRIVGILAWIGIWAVLIGGPEIKGAKRWLSLGGFSLQPSEFLKPAFAVLIADLLSRGTHFSWVMVALGVVLFPLFFQPDLGMIFLMGAVCFCQCFVAGLSWIWTLGIGLMTLSGAGAIYVCFPHAAARIQSFLAGGGKDPFGSHYQILQALKSFSSGGLWGKGPGAGTILNSLPDGHADFIFAVAGEELGLMVCLIILTLYGFIIFRCLWHAFQETDAFYTLSIVGLTLQFAFQTLLNIASVLRIIPTKGVTLPFMSYGGSSFLSLCLSMGMVLALTRRYRGLI